MRLRPDLNWDVISTYSDSQAIDDGFLIAVNAKDRCSLALWEHLRERCPITESPTRKPDELRDDYALFECVRVLHSHGDIAREIYEKNIGGGIADTMEFGKKAWILPNENGGLTLMFPEDY